MWFDLLGNLFGFLKGGSGSDWHRLCKCAENIDNRNRIKEIKSRGLQFSEACSFEIGNGVNRWEDRDVHWVIIFTQ